MFSITNCLLAAPAVVREIHEVRVDVMGVAEDVTAALKKRFSDDGTWRGTFQASGVGPVARTRSA